MAVTEQDTTIFNASAYRTPEGSMLEDLAKQLLGGEINEEGKLMIHGKEVKKILVDGKEFFSDDPKVALKNLPVEMVEKLKTYERKSDLARLTGIDDGDEEMILYLFVKKGIKTGWMENFMVGIGTKDRYVYNWDADSDDFETNYDGLSSNCFENQYNTHLFDIGIRTNRKKYNYTIGLDFAPPKKKSESYSFLNEEARGNIEKNVLNFSPTVNFRYKHSKRTQLQIIYRGKGKQPRVNDLQPVVVPPLPLTRMVIGMHPVLFP